MIVYMVDPCWDVLFLFAHSMRSPQHSDSDTNTPDTAMIFRILCADGR